MTIQNMEARRESFEVIACEHYLLCELDHTWSERDLEYVDTEMQVAFEVYNAALDSICVGLPSPIQAPNEEDFGDDYEAYEYEEGHTVSMNRLLAECKDALTAAGVSFK